MTSLVPSRPLGTSQIWDPLFTLLAGRRRLPAVGTCNNGLMFLASPDIALHRRIWGDDLQGLTGVSLLSLVNTHMYLWRMEGDRKIRISTSCRNRGERLAVGWH